MTFDAFSFNLVLAAAGLGLTHTVLGPDHWLPFLMLAKARGWSRPRTIAITALCGAGHVVSSLVLGGLGVAAGMAVARFESVEAGRGNLAAWALTGFGLAYATWGVRKAIRASRGLHPHAHGNHVHLHTHGDGEHRHEAAARGSATTFWTLFLVLVLGPCEPLIPLFVLPASRGRFDLALVAALVFGLVTVGSMIGLTLAGLAGLERLPLGSLERWSHALAGAVIAASGLAVLTLGL